MPAYMDPYSTGTVDDRPLRPGFFEGAISTQKTPGWALAAMSRWRRVNAWRYGPALEGTGKAGGILRPAYWWRSGEIGHPYLFQKTAHRASEFTWGKATGKPVSWASTGETAAASRTAGRTLSIGSNFAYGTPMHGGDDAFAARLLEPKHIPGRAMQWTEGAMTQAFGNAETAVGRAVLREGAEGAIARKGAAWVGESAFKATAVRGAARFGTLATRFAGPVGLALAVADAVRLGVFVANRGVQTAIMGLNEATKSTRIPILGQGLTDNQNALTARQRAVEQIQRSRLNARSIIGAEGAFFHQHYG